MLIFLACSVTVGVVTAQGHEWIAAASGLVDIHVRSLPFGGVGFTVRCAFPILAEWILVGRWKPRGFPLRSLSSPRFRIVRSLLHAHPLVFLVGNPLYVMYLRALGARIGKDVAVLSRSVPVRTDLIATGAGTVIRKESFLLGHRAHAGRIQAGRVTLGQEVFVGEKTVPDIARSMGDGAQLGHSSCVFRGQAVPQGRTPARIAGTTDPDRLREARCSTLRRAGYGLATLLQLFFLHLPVSIGGLYSCPPRSRRSTSGRRQPAVTAGGSSSCRSSVQGGVVRCRSGRGTSCRHRARPLSAPGAPGRKQLLTPPRPTAPTSCPRPLCAQVKVRCRCTTCR
ncbi:hypothetical protein [Streptomyces sp. NPDC096153]|uniref:hypothetical protein n=1 Tax=Streptomyces sp. NPDC096153 TaxID=3155548 RepID=UPI003318EB01